MEKFVEVCWKIEIPLGYIINFLVTLECSAFLFESNDVSAVMLFFIYLILFFIVLFIFPYLEVD
jgi:hypothetical protein